MNTEWSPEREMLPCPACRGELTCWTSQQENQNWNLICFFFCSFSLFHYSLKLMLHEMNQLSTKKCANLQEQCGRSSAPSPTVLNSVFLLLLASIFPSLTTNLSILCGHFLRISKLYLLFSSHSTKTFIKALILILFIN